MQKKNLEVITIADQHNANIPAVANQISADIPDIKENLEFHKDALQRIFETWSDSDNSAAKIDTVVGFNDGTYNYEFPTNGVGAHSVFMLGTSSTIIWMYLNAAPPGWKVLATGADTVLAVSGGAAAYNANGGTQASVGGATWTQPNHVHATGDHNHQWYVYSANASYTWASDGSTQAPVTTASNRGAIGAIPIGGGNSNVLTWSPAYTKDTDPGNTANGATANTWRPLGSIGKLYQLDTA